MVVNIWFLIIDDGFVGFCCWIIDRIYVFLIFIILNIIVFNYIYVIGEMVILYCVVENFGIKIVSWKVKVLKYYFNYIKLIDFKNIVNQKDIKIV